MATGPKDYAAITDGINHGISGLRQSGALDTISAFGALSKAAMADRALDKKTKELIALAIGAAEPRDGCFGFHTKALKRLSAADQEVAEAWRLPYTCRAGLALCMLATHGRHWKTAERPDQTATGALIWAWGV